MCFMQILTNLSKAELNQLTSQPTAKALIEKNKACAVNISKGDAKSAAEFVANRNKEKRTDSIQISDAGLEALKKSLNSTSKGVKITKENNNYNISFKNTAYAYRAIKKDYIDIDGEKFVLGEKEKSELKKSSRQSF